MTAIDQLLPIARDMTASLSSEDRSRRLVDAVHRALPCDAVALLRLEQDTLIPVATYGLLQDAMGRRFPRREHPRLDVVCSSDGPTMFADDCELPDPYDGLVEGAPPLDESVHACLGCPLRVEGELVGVLTADSLKPGAFDAVSHEFLDYLAALAGAALRTSDLIDALQRSAERQGRVARDLVRDALLQRGDRLVGESAAMRRMRASIDLVANSDYTVLVTGETGTGKELVVRMLHTQSPRADEPLVYVNCAALPSSVAESELFGHTRGAFTGAQAARAGKFGVADGATLFLDEIGELPIHVQPMLLRALQEGEIQPVGSDATERVDVRVLAATNRNLEVEVREGRFRADLFHRLDVVRIDVPPLRDRRDDVGALAGHFADYTRRRLGTGPVRYEPSALAVLEAADWPGNVRELENVVSRGILHAAARCSGTESVVVRASDLHLRHPEGAVPKVEATEASARPKVDGADVDQLLAALADTALEEGTPLRQLGRDVQRSAVAAALERSHGSLAGAARLLDVDRSNLHRLTRSLGLR